MTRRNRKPKKAQLKGRERQQQARKTEYDWTRTCQCGNKPVHKKTDMCAACTFGSAEAYVESLDL